MPFKVKSPFFILLVLFICAFSAEFLSILLGFSGITFAAVAHDGRAERVVFPRLRQLGGVLSVENLKTWLNRQAFYYHYALVILNNISDKILPP